MVKTTQLDRSKMHFKKRKLKHAKNVFNEVNSDENRNIYIKAKNKYNNARKKKSQAKIYEK